LVDVVVVRIEDGERNKRDAKLEIYSNNFVRRANLANSREFRIMPYDSVKEPEVANSTNLSTCRRGSAFQAYFGAGSFAAYWGTGKEVYFHNST
jgi:hypothetical protein